MDSRNPIEFQAIPVHGLHCDMVKDVNDKKTPGAAFRLEINKTELRSITQIEKYCDGNCFRMTLTDPANESQVSFLTKNKNKFRCDSRESEGGKTIINFVLLRVTVARREVPNLNLLWDVLLASQVKVELEPAQPPIPGLGDDDLDREAESVEEDFADQEQPAPEAEKKTGKRGRGKK